MGEKVTLKEGYIQSAEPYESIIVRRGIFETLPIKEGCIMFVGDSLTQRNEWADMLNNKNVVNRGIDSDRITWLNERMPNLLANKPSKVFLKIGINDIWDGKRAPQIAEEYSMILDQFKTIENCTVYVQSCLPVNNTEYNHKINNQDVQEVNHALEKLAHEYGYEYINLYDAFINERNELKEEYTHDGAHLTGQGYVAWKKQIEKYI